MENPVLAPEIQHFIQDHIGADITRLALQKNPFPAVSWLEILNQIAAKTKSKEKLPTWFNTTDIIYPAKISIEQTSSEKTALYKSQIVSGETLIDLTGGFGVDDFYFAKAVKKVIHCEINPQLSTLVRHNFQALGIDTISCITGDSTEILKTIPEKLDWIYVDPSRRSDHKGKVFMLQDCLPNVPELLDFYFEHTDAILIKTAPILDLSSGISELSHVKNIHIVAVENEVKELLWELTKDYTGAITLKTVNITNSGTEYFQSTHKETIVDVQYSLPKKYLYEPNSAIMKSGSFDTISRTFHVEKLHQHSHLYTSNELIDFPGRRFEIQSVVPYQKKEMGLFKGKKVNITTRNFPDSVENIRKKWKINDGGNDYCFFTTDVNTNKIILICTKIKNT